MATKKDMNKKSLPWGLSHEGLKPGSMKVVTSCPNDVIWSFRYVFCANANVV